MQILNVVVTSRFGHAVEVGSCTHSVGSHVLENNPITSIEIGHWIVLLDAVETVASWAPDAAGETRVISIIELLRIKGIHHISNEEIVILKS